MVAAGVQSVKLIVEDVGKPRQRMPVARVAFCECPDDPLGGRVMGDMRVFVDILVVVKIDEIVIDCLAEDYGNRQHEKTANGPCRVDISAAGPRRRRSAGIPHGICRAWLLECLVVLPPPIAAFRRVASFGTAAHAGLPRQKTSLPQNLITNRLVRQFTGSKVEEPAAMPTAVPGREFEPCRAASSPSRFPPVPRFSETSPD